MTTLINLNKFFSLQLVRFKLMHESMQNYAHLVNWLTRACDLCLSYQQGHYILEPWWLRELDFSSFLYDYLGPNWCMRVVWSLQHYDHKFYWLTPAFDLCVGYQPGSLHHTQAAVLGDQQGHGAAGRRRLLTLCDGLRKVSWTSNLPSNHKSLEAFFQDAQTHPIITRGGWHTHEFESSHTNLHSRRQAQAWKWQRTDQHGQI